MTTPDEDLLICKACGTQFDVLASSPLSACRICDDPRQYVPPTGQAWTSLGEMRGKYENKWEQDPEEPSMWSIWTEPKFAIGQRAILIQTSQGNVLWDLIAYLDQKTIDFINSLGGLDAIVISHPHYYTTHATWSTTFNCPIHISYEDTPWLSRRPAPTLLHEITTPTSTPLPSTTAIKTGGHFPGSLVLHLSPPATRKPRLLIADTFLTVPSALYHAPRPPGTASYAFMWSIPNMIPLAPDAVMGIWCAVRGVAFESTHGAFRGMDVRSVSGRAGEVKERVLESMKIMVRAEGWEGVEVLGEEVPSD